MPLKRVIGFREALAINIGAIIGAGIFVISGLAAGIAGPSTILAILIGAFISVLTGLSYAQLAHVYSHEGGNYYYTTKLLGSYPGMIVGLMFILSTIVGGAVVALSFGSYFSSIVGHAISPVEVAIGLIAILGTINYVGVPNLFMLFSGLGRFPSLAIAKPTLDMPSIIDSTTFIVAKSAPIDIM